MKAWEHLAHRLRRQDGRLAPLIEAIGAPRLELETSEFRALAENILSQQLATKAARSIIEKVSALSRPFPGPETILKMNVKRLRASGVSQAKVEYLKALSRQWQISVWRKGWGKCSDEDLVERLTQVKGIGEWTAHMFLIFSLGRPNVFPIGDFGIRRGVMWLLKLDEMPLPKQMRELVPEWEGAYSVASWYLWQAQDRKLLIAGVDPLAPSSL
ncbi:MAG: DNA-3-methyladenine glycosylase 2 family protein [Deltaproteobacteria bacterium]|nr:DNA-3-methyladenine glycosylase 2 family protein [Deltaproteobacteria bacterium]